MGATERGLMMREETLRNVLYELATESDDKKRWVLLSRALMLITVSIPGLDSRDLDRDLSPFLGEEADG